MGSTVPDLVLPSHLRAIALPLACTGTALPGATAPTALAAGGALLSGGGAAGAEGGGAAGGGAATSLGMSWHGRLGQTGRGQGTTNDRPGDGEAPSDDEAEINPELDGDILDLGAFGEEAFDVCDIAFV